MDFRVLERPLQTIGLCVGVSLLLLAGAHLFERVGGLPPCPLCLDQREAHWAAAAAGGLTLILARIGTGQRTMASALGALTLLYIFSTGLAGYHAGVEWGFWPGPATCSSAGTADLASSADLLASLSGPADSPSCSDAAWRMAGISMAGYNSLISAGLAVIALIACTGVAKTIRNDKIGSVHFVH
ncbi:MAG: disulfide bond formation protein B [Pseudomonadota bacterium]